MDERYDIVIIGGGEAGQAAAYLARKREASVAVIDRELYGGSCPYWACMPSKALLHAASIHALGGDYPWQKASDFRDWMIVREEIDWPDDSGHVRGLEEAGATVIRGHGRIDGPGRVVVRTDAGERALEAGAILVAVGTNPTIPDDIEGLDTITPWTNRQATTTRELPKSLVVLGGGPTGLEMSQVFARYGVPVTLVVPRDHVNHRDHHRNSETLEAALRKDGVDIRTGVRARRVRGSAGTDGAHIVELTDGTSVEGHEILLAVGRTAPLTGLGLETVGAANVDGWLAPDERLRIADGVFAAGDPAGPEMHTHLAVYQGEMAIRIALGDDAKPDHSAIPHATYTDPETSGVGLTLEQAIEAGHDAFEETQDLATTAKGYVAEAEGHATIVVDRKERRLLGAFVAAPGAAEAIGEAVLAIKLDVPLEVLADTIHPFPTTLRVLGNLFVTASRRLGASGASSSGAS